MADQLPQILVRHYAGCKAHATTAAFGACRLYAECHTIHFGGHESHSGPILLQLVDQATILSLLLDRFPVFSRRMTGAELTAVPAERRYGFF